MSEIQLQAASFQWAWNTYPNTRYFFFAVPNEAKRSLILAQQLKASGMIAGIPDMLLIYGGHIYGFEFKDGKKGILSKNQEKIHDIWRKSGVYVYIIREFSEFQQIFTSIMEL